ncbi:Triosephosphate isomerase [Buchnera aphidicola (Eriosoma lanigerum)]
MKKPIIIGNWKLNGNKATIYNVLHSLIHFLKEKIIDNTIVIIPPSIYLDYTHQLIHNTKIFLGGQNIDINLQGAFTGDISLVMLKDVGVHYVLLGHSERRTYHQENNLLIAKKFKLVKDLCCIPILCIGENKEEKDHDQTKCILSKQLNIILDICGENAFDNAIIAYEPVWSIGTGNIPNPNYIQKIHEYIKQYIQIKTQKKDKILNISIIYGGSVNQHNIQNILQEKDVDGVLVGGGCLKYHTFSQIIQLASSIKKYNFN